MSIDSLESSTRRLSNDCPKNIGNSFRRRFVRTGVSNCRIPRTCFGKKLCCSVVACHGRLRPTRALGDETSHRLHPTTTTDPPSHPLTSGYGGRDDVAVASLQSLVCLESPWADSGTNGKWTCEKPSPSSVNRLHLQPRCGVLYCGPPRLILSLSVQVV